VTAVSVEYKGSGKWGLVNPAGKVLATSLSVSDLVGRVRGAARGPVEVRELTKFGRHRRSIQVTGQGKNRDAEVSEPIDGEALSEGESSGGSVAVADEFGGALMQEMGAFFRFRQKPDNVFLRRSDVFKALAIHFGIYDQALGRAGSGSVDKEKMASKLHAVISISKAVDGLAAFKEPDE